MSAARRSAVRDWAEYAAFRAALWTLASAPRRQAFRLARLYTGLLDHAVPKLRRVADENLIGALPELDASQRRQVIDGVFDSIARILLTFASFPQMTRENIGSWLRVEGQEHVDAALARQRGVIFATGHLGNWELSAFAFALLAQPIHIVVRPFDNRRIDEFVTGYRERSGNRCIGKRDYARGILQALSKNQMVGVLADQHDQAGLAIDVFRKPAMASTGVARFSAKTGAAVVPGFALWSAAEEKFVLRFHPEIPISGRLEDDTRRIHARIEEVIRSSPEQWMWIHRRWKI